MQRAFLAAIVCVVCASPASAEVCAEISDNDNRLACYDKAFPPREDVPDAPTRPATASAVESKWQTMEEVSKIDDRTNVWLVVESDNMIDGRFGESKPARLSVRCMKNTTAVMLEFAGHFMSDIQGFGDVTYRIDKKPAQTRGFIESTDHSLLGLWRGGSSIPFVKSLFGGERLFVRAVPFNEGPVEAEFTIAGLEEEIAPLREACGW